MTIYQVTSVHRVDDVRIARMSKALSEGSRKVAIVGMVEESGAEVDGPWRVISYGRFSRCRASRLLAQPRLYFTLRRQGAKVIQFHDPELLPLMLALAGRGGRRRTIVYDMHEDVAASLRDRGSPDWVVWLYNRFLRMAPGRIHVTLAEDSYTGLLEGEHPVLHNYPYWSPVDLRERKKRVIYVGDISRGRGCFEMLRGFAVSGLLDWTLAIVGPCNEPGTIEALREEAERLGMGQRLEVAGAVPPGDVKHWLAESSMGLALLHPLRNYCRCPPGKVFEYALAGLPAVVSDFPVYRRCFGCLPSVEFTDPLDVGAIGQAMARLAAEMPPGSVPCTEAQGIVEERFTWAREARRVQSFFDGLLHDGPEAKPLRRAGTTVAEAGRT